MIDISELENDGSAHCPRCGASGLTAFSPSGLGVAACDACGTYWEEGAWRSNWTASNLAQCRVGWDSFRTQEEAEAHQAQCTYPDGVSYHPYDTPGESWSN